MISHNGFRLMLDPSEAVLIFTTPEISTRNQLIKLMKDNSRNYADFEINMVVPETSLSVVVTTCRLTSRAMRCHSNQKTVSCTTIRRSP